MFLSSNTVLRYNWQGMLQILYHPANCAGSHHSHAGEEVFICTNCIHFSNIVSRHPAQNMDIEPKMKIKKVDYQVRKVRLLTAVSVILFVTCFILTVCSMHQKNEHKRDIQRGEAQERTLQEQLKELVNARAEEQSQWHTEKEQADEDWKALAVNLARIEARLAEENARHDEERDQHRRELEGAAEALQNSEGRRERLTLKIRSLETLIRKSDASVGIRALVNSNLPDAAVGIRALVESRK